MADELPLPNPTDTNKPVQATDDGLPDVTIEAQQVCDDSEEDEPYLVQES